MTSAEMWTVVASLGSAISAVAAAITAFLLFRQMKGQAAANKEERAAQFVLEYIRLSIGHPKFSTTTRGQDYEWYVVATLLMAREVVEAYPNDRSWHDLVRQHLGFHREELIRWEDADLQPFGPSVGALVADIVSNKGAK